MTPIASPIEQELVPLSELEVKDEGVVFVANLEIDEQATLAAMGLYEEASFRLCQQGQPCIIQVEATRLGLSQDVTSRIMVRRCSVCNEA